MISWSSQSQLNQTNKQPCMKNSLVFISSFLPVCSLYMGWLYIQLMIESSLWLRACSFDWLVGEWMLFTNQYTSTSPLHFCTNLHVSGVNDRAAQFHNCSKSILIYPLRSILYTDKLINIMTITLICSINPNGVLREHVNLITFPFIPFLDSSSFICRLALCTSGCCLPENKSLPFSWALSCYPDTLSLMLTAPLSQGGSLIRKKKSSGLHQANKKATGHPSRPHHPLFFFLHLTA